MKIGYSVEGSTDRALLEGLRRKWCPQAKLIEGRFRGQTRESRRREIPNICRELHTKEVDMMIFLSDSNDLDWRYVLRAETERLLPEHAHLAVVGVCLRNVECWLSADPDMIANKFGRNRSEFTGDDPKGIVEFVFGVTRQDKREEEIAQFVYAAPLRHWMQNASFEDFFDKLWDKSRELGCTIGNLRGNQ